MVARLGAKDKKDETWTEIARSFEDRVLDCVPPEVPLHLVLCAKQFTVWVYATAGIYTCIA